MRRTILLVLGLILVATVVPAFAGDRVIANGIDPWRTKGDGTTFASFEKQPIPAGFFCTKSEPFAGRIPMRGVPIVLDQAGALGETDTIIQRLDDAAFNKRGIATTRIQVRAMTFEGIDTLKTACGEFKVRLSLNGEQPITQMRIIRDADKRGHFVAPIAVNIKLTFEPVGGTAGELLQIDREVRFPPAQNALWRDPSLGQPVRHEGMLLVDTDGDRRPDTFIPGTSNFVAGRGGLTGKLLYQDPVCHTSDDGDHCPI